MSDDLKPVEPGDIRAIPGTNTFVDDQGRVGKMSSEDHVIDHTNASANGGIVERSGRYPWGHGEPSRDITDATEDSWKREYEGVWTQEAIRFEELRRKGETRSVSDQAEFDALGRYLSGRGDQHIIRKDKYHVQIGEITVVAMDATEQRIRDLTPEQLGRFQRIFRDRN